MHARLLSPQSDFPAPPSRNGIALYDAPVYPYTSIFRSSNLELSIRSPRIQSVEDVKFAGQSIPVFNGRDSIGGIVATAIPSATSKEHWLVISIEGAFFWMAPQKELPQTVPISTPLPSRIKHVFLSSSVTIPLIPSPLSSPLRSLSIRSVLQDGIRKTFRRTKFGTRRRRGKVKSEKQETDEAHNQASAKSFHSFAFPLPIINDREVPSTISVSRVRAGGLRGRWYAEGAQIAYKLTAHVHPVAADPKTFGEALEAPILIESRDYKEEFDSDLLLRSWSHSELICLKPQEFRCMLSLPEPAHFSRSDGIPFYVFFITDPKSNTLARRIMKNAIIRVTLVRRLHLDAGVAIQVPTPRTHNSDGEQEKKRRGRSRSLPRRATTHTPKIFKWNRRASEQAGRATRDSTSKGSSKGQAPLRDKPLPPLPTETSSTFEDVVCSVSSEGFPKRVFREKMHSRSHYPKSGSDGVFKGELCLFNELSNTIDWPGLSLSYFVEASVSFEDNIVRTRHGVRLAEAYN